MGTVHQSCRKTSTINQDSFSSLYHCIVGTSVPCPAYQDYNATEICLVTVESAVGLGHTEEVHGNSTNSRSRIKECVENRANLFQATERIRDEHWPCLLALLVVNCTVTTTVKNSDQAKCNNTQQQQYYCSMRYYNNSNQITTLLERFDQGCEGPKNSFQKGWVNTGITETRWAPPASTKKLSVTSEGSCSQGQVLCIKTKLPLKHTSPPKFLDVQCTTHHTDCTTQSYVNHDTLCHSHQWFHAISEFTGSCKEQHQYHK